MQFGGLAVAQFTASPPFADCRTSGGPWRVCVRHEMPIEFAKCRPSGHPMEVPVSPAFVLQCLVALLLLLPIPALAQSALTTRMVNMRAGPDVRVSAGDLVAGKEPGIRGWLHGRRALVRRGLRPQPRLGVLEVSLDATREPVSHRHVFGRIVLGCPLSVASVVCRQTALDRLGDAVLPAARAEALSARGRSRPYFFGMMPR